EGSRDHALALELTHIAKVDEDDVVPFETRSSLLEADRRDASLRLVDHLAEPFAKLHGEPPRRRVARQSRVNSTAWWRTSIRRVAGAGSGGAGRHARPARPRPRR